MSAPRYRINDLVRVARRDCETERPYLYVNPLQGKHIPAAPSVVLELTRELATLADGLCGGDGAIIAGFAETATALGAGAALFSGSAIFCIHTTRERATGRDFLYFTESHSHATDQSLAADGLREALTRARRMIFVEDEVTTGRTIMKLVAALRERFGINAPEFGIVSALNSMDEARIEELHADGVECRYIMKLPRDYGLSALADRESCAAPEYSLAGNIPPRVLDIGGALDLRVIQDKEAYAAACERFAAEAADAVRPPCVPARILVLGTEEFMFPPLLLARELERICPGARVLFHATTRSPIMVSARDGYPLTTRRELRSLYDPARRTFIYNLAPYDLAVVATDASDPSAGAISDLFSALADAGARDTRLVRWHH